MGSSAFVQFALINNPTDMLSSSLISSKILSRCPQFFNFDGVATSSLPTGKYFLVYVSGSSSQSLELSLLLATFIPLITDDLLVTSPLSVFMVIDVLLPFIPNLFGNLSKMKVPGYSCPKVHRFSESCSSPHVLNLLELHTYLSPPYQYSMMHMLLLHHLFSPHLHHCYTGVEYCQLSF